MNFGCLFIRWSILVSIFGEVFYFIQENFELVWFVVKMGDKLLERRYLIKVDSEEINGVVYFGWFSGCIFCIVIFSNDQCDKWVGDWNVFGFGVLLKINGY